MKNSISSKTNKGLQSEQVAAIYLSNNGYTILHRNYRHSRYEIDIIASKDDILHFIEVKSLSSSDQVYPEVHVTRKKMESLKKAARQFLFENPGFSLIQFDVLSVVLKKDAPPEFFLIEDVYL